MVHVSCVCPAQRVSMCPMSIDSAPPRGRLRERTAEELRVLLARRRMSAAELARQTGIKQSTMARRMTGETAFDLDDLEVIANALGIKVADLFRRVDEQTTDPKIRLVERTTPHTPNPTSRPNGRPTPKVAKPTPQPNGQPSHVVSPTSIRPDRLPRSPRVMASAV